MGFKVDGQGWYVAFVIVVASVLALSLWALQFNEPAQLNRFYLTDIYFFPSPTFVLTDSEPEVTPDIRAELKESAFRMTIEIEEASINWTVNYTYSYIEGRDVFEADLDDASLTSMSEWRYGQEYRYRIRFECDSDDATVRSLSLFDEENHREGSFMITRDDGDEVRFYDNDRPFHEYHGRTWIVYYGDAPTTWNYDDVAFLVEIRIEGKRYMT